MVARCGIHVGTHTHEVPTVQGAVIGNGLSCRAGIYAWKPEEGAVRAATVASMQNLNESLVGFRLLSWGFVPCYGQVYLWGRLVEHTDGWRAQYAYPKMLRLWDEEIGAKLRDSYLVDVEVM